MMIYSLSLKTQLSCVSQSWLTQTHLSCLARLYYKAVELTCTSCTSRHPRADPWNMDRYGPCKTL